MEAFHTKKQKQHWFIKALAIIVFICIVFLGGYAVVARWEHRTYDSKMSYGITFSSKYAEELGISDWRAAYSAVLYELKPTTIRLPIYWDRIEKNEGVIDLADIEWMLTEAAAANVKVVPVVGERVPRWPECHPPEWAKAQWLPDRKEAELHMIEYVVTRLKSYTAIQGWQVENEPFLASFGMCPSPDEHQVRSAITLVHDIDPDRPIMLTDTGELSSWVKVADMADVVGVSMYRVTWHRLFGYFYYNLPPELYTFKKYVLTKSTGKRFVISELQAEPWPPGKSILDTSLAEQYRTMDPERLKRNIDYAQRTSFDTAYLWGAEWWYYLKEIHKQPTMWDTAKEVMTANIPQEQK